MRIFFYILKLFLKLTAGILFLAMFMFVLSDLVDKYSRLFEKYNATSKQIFNYYLYEIPFQLIQILPFAALIGSIGAMIILNRSGEIIAIRAAGLGPLRIAKPIIFGGLLCMVFTFAASEELVPNAAIKKNKLVENLKGVVGGQLADTKWLRSGEWVYSFANFDLYSKSLLDVKGYKTRANGKGIKQMWGADQATYNDKLGNWTLSNHREVIFYKNSLKSNKYSITSAVDLPYKPNRLFKDERNPIELSYTELLMKISELKESGAQFRRHQVAFHVKLGYCFAALLLSLLGLKFGFKFERNTSIMKSLLISIFFGVGYWFVLSSTRALVLSGSLPTWLAGWSANIFLAGVMIIESKKITNSE